MNNRCVWIIGFCLLPYYLMSMQELIVIERACELKTLALTVRPEAYEKKLEEYFIKPSAVIDSTSVLLGSEYVPDGSSQHVCHMKDHNPVRYKKLVMQIMQAYCAQRNNDQELMSDIVQTDVYKKVVQDIRQSDATVEDLKVSSFECCFSSAIPGMCAVVFGLFDIVLLAKFYS